MRKKYLSALLFGALLVTSAGTFTSCKDYDDDINNLQEQINTIKTDLASLTETVNNLDGVKTLSYADGKLIIETGKGTKVEVPVPSATGVTEVKLEGNVLYVNGEEAGKVEVGEGEIVKVEVKEDGKLYINDEVQDLEIGSKVVMVDNGNGTYTMTVDGESYVLPKASNGVAVSSLTIVPNVTFGQVTDDDGDGTKKATVIAWGYNGSQNQDMKNWKGPKGPVSANQAMVGGIEIANGVVTVTPVNAELDAQELALYDSKGNKAPVKVIATPNATGLAVDTRASSSNGKWNLSIEIDDNLTKDNIYSTFHSSDPAGYKLYSLYVNGIAMTGYDIAIKVGETGITGAATIVAKVTANNDVNVTGAYNNHDLAAKLPAGKTTEFTVFDRYAYDSYISFDGTYADKAEKYGIKAEGLSVIVPETAVNVTDLVATLNVMNINGTVEKETITISTTGHTTEDKVTLDATQYKVTPAFKEILIDLSKALEGMTTAQIEAVDQLDHIRFEEIKDQNNFLLNTLGINTTDGTTTLDGKVVFLDADFNVVSSTVFANKGLKVVKYAMLLVENNIANDAKPGDYKLEMTMYDGTYTAGNSDLNEVRKVTIPVSVSLPTFDELFPKVSSTDVWANGESTLRMQNGMKLDYTIAFNKANGAAFDDKFVVEFDNVNNKNVKDDIANGVVTLKSDIIDQNKLISNELGTEITYKIDGKDGLAIKSGKFTTNVLTMFEGAKLVYYKDGAVLDKAQAAYTDGKYIITPMDKDTNEKKQGLAIQFANSEESFINTAIKFNTVTLNDIMPNSSFAKPTEGVNRVYTVDGLGEGVTAGHDNDGVNIGGTYNGQSATLVVNCWDSNNIKTSFTIPFEAVVK